MPERKLNLHDTQWIVQALARLLCTYAVIQGALIVLGGAQRWQSRGLATAMSVPGAPESWGIVLAALGVLGLIATFKPWPMWAAVALVGMAAWSFFFAITLADTIIRDPRVATTGSPVYTLSAVVACVLATAYWRSRA